MKLLFSVIFICINIRSDAQQLKHLKNRYVSLAFSNNHPAKPFRSFSKLAYENLHPGFELGTGFSWKVKRHHQLIQSASIGYFYHQWIQHAVTLNTSFGYQYNFTRSFGMNVSIGTGYLHSITDGKILILQESGEYTSKKNKGRSQVIASLGIGISHSITQRYALFSEYKQKLQFPFINEYVPILPYNALSFGIRYHLINN